MSCCLQAASLCQAVSSQSWCGDCATHAQACEAEEEELWANNRGLLDAAAYCSGCTVAMLVLSLRQLC